MSYKDLYTNLTPTQSLAPAARTASADGTAVDRKFNESLIAVIDVGAWTDGTHTFALEESDDNTTFTEVAASQIQGTLPVINAADEDNTTYHVGYLGVARYVRVSVTVASATTGAVYGASIIQDYPRYAGSSQLTP